MGMAGERTMSRIEEKRVARMRGQGVARIALAIGLAALGGYILQNFIRALLWAVILAIATGPLYARIAARCSKDKHRVVLPLLFTLGTALLFIVPLALIAIQVGGEARVAARWITDVREHGAPVPDWMDHLPVLHNQAVAWWTANISDPEGARALFQRIEHADLLVMGRRFGGALVHRAVQVGFTLVALFFLFREGHTLADKLLVVTRRVFGPEGEPLARQMVASVHGTVDGLVLVGLGVGAILGLGYALAGVPHAALLGCATAIAAVVPMGAPIVLVIAALLVLALGKTMVAIALLAGGMIIIFVADHAIRPALIGGTTRLPFLWVLLGILGGVETFGLLGLFLGPAVMAALILLWREWIGDDTTGCQE
jgi:predicted PurR-regulated permease PerM